MNPVAEGWTAMLLKELFRPEIQQHNKSIDELIEKNNQLIGHYNSGFNYSGTNYGFRGRMGWGYPDLARELVPTMQRLYSLKNQVVLDRILITQFLHKLLQPCDTSMDVRNALPDCLAALSPLLAQRQRTAEAAHTLTNPRDLRQYEKLLPKIEMYCAMRYIY